MRKKSWTQTTSGLCSQNTKPRHHHFKIWLSNIILRSKSCTFVKFFFNFWLFVKNVSRIWRVVKLLVQNLTKCQKKIKNLLLRKAEKLQARSFLRSKTNRKVIVRTQVFFQNMTRFIFFYFIIWHVAQCWFENSTRCKKYSWKTCFLQNQKKCTSCRLYGVKTFKKWIFQRKLFRILWNVLKVFTSKSDTL